jgi:hypothetical protein
MLGHEGLYGTMNPGVRRSNGPLDFLYGHDSPGELEVFYFTYVAVAACVLLGFVSRVSVPLLLLFHTFVGERNPYYSYGADAVFQHTVFWMMFLNTGRVWSVDAWLACRQVRAPPTDVELWPLKCIQIQVALIYLYTGYFKVQSEVWADGSAIWYAIQGFGLDTALTPWLLENRWLIPPLTYASLLFELSFPFGVFTSYRYLFLFGGVLFHLGIDLFMMIRFFSFVMLVSYLAYVEPEHWLRFLVWAKRISGGMTA